MGSGRKMAGCVPLTENFYGRKARGRKLRQDHGAEILARYALGESAKAIADRFGANYGVVVAYLKECGVVLRDQSQRKRTYRINENAFAVIDNEKAAYFLGFLYADGYNHGAGVTVTQKDGEDNYILQKFLDFLETDRPLKAYANSGHGDKLMTASIWNRKIGSDLAKWGCVKKKTHAITFPSWMKKELISHFVRGYFDGDGSISIKDGRRGYWNIVGTVDFCHSIAQLINDLCGEDACKFYVRHPDRNNNITQLFVSKKKNILRVCEWMYADATVYLTRKYDRYKSII